MQVPYVYRFLDVTSQAISEEQVGHIGVLWMLSHKQHPESGDERAQLPDHCSLLLLLRRGSPHQEGGWGRTPNDSYFFP